MTSWQVPGHGSICDIEDGHLQEWHAVAMGATTWMTLPTFNNVSPAEWRRRQAETNGGEWHVLARQAPIDRWVNAMREFAFLTDEGEVAGAVALAGDVCPARPDVRAVSLALAIAPNHRGKHHALALTQELPAIIRDWVGIEHITAYDCPTNQASLALMEHTGWDQIPGNSRCVIPHPPASACSGWNIQFCHGDHTRTTVITH